MAEKVSRPRLTFLGTWWIVSNWDDDLAEKGYEKRVAKHKPIIPIAFYHLSGESHPKFGRIKSFATLIYFIRLSPRYYLRNFACVSNQVVWGTIVHILFPFWNNQWTGLNSGREASWRFSLSNGKCGTGGGTSTEIT